MNLGKCGEEVSESLFINPFLKDNLRRYIVVTLRSVCLGRQLYLGQLALCAQHLFLIEKHDLFTHYATPVFKKNLASVHFAFLVNTSFFFFPLRGKVFPHLDVLCVLEILTLKGHNVQLFLHLHLGSAALCPLAAPFSDKLTEGSAFSLSH